MAWHRQDDLARHLRWSIVHLMHIQTDVQVGDDVAPSTRFEFPSLSEAIHTANNHITATQDLGGVLPTAGAGVHLGSGVDTSDDPLGSGLSRLGRRPC